MISALIDTNILAVIATGIIAGLGALAAYFRNSASKAKDERDDANRTKKQVIHALQVERELSAADEKARKSIKEKRRENASRGAGKRPTGNFRR